MVGENTPQLREGHAVRGWAIARLEIVLIPNNSNRNLPFTIRLALPVNFNATTIVTPPHTHTQCLARVLVCC